MTNNLDLTQLAAAQNNKETTINDTNGELDAALTAANTFAIDNTNALTLTNDEFRRLIIFALIDDSPVPTGTITVTVPAISRGVFAVLNRTSFDAVVEVSGQSDPSPSVPAGELGLFTCGGSNVRAPANAAGNFLALSDTPSVYTGQAGKAAIVNDGETGLEFGVVSGASGTAVAVHPEFKGAQIRLTADESIPDNTLVHIPWDAAVYDTTYQPSVGGAQRFWLGTNKTFVDGDVTVGTDVVAEAGHGFTTGEGPVRLTNSGGALPTGLSTGTNYWIIAVDANNIAFATNRSNALADVRVDITAAAGGGTHTIETADKLVVPAGVTKVRIVAQASWEDIGTNSGARFTNIDKNGASFQGGGADERNAVEGATTDEKTRQVITSGVVEVVEGDFFQMQVRQRQGVALNLTTANSTNFFIEVVETTESTQLPTSFIGVQPKQEGAVLALSAAETIANSTTTLIPWDTATFDTRFQPPDAGGTQRFWLGPNKTFVDGDVTVGTDVIAETAHGFTTGEGPVRLTTSGTLPTGLATGTDYWIIAVDDDNIALATSRANALADTRVDITAASGGGTHTINTATKLVVPAGVTKVRLTGNIHWALNASGNRFFAIRTNFTTDIASDTDAPSFTNEQSGAVSPVLEVSEGDVFEIRALQNSGGNLNIQTTVTAFGIEVVDTSKSLTFPGVTIERPWIGARIEKTANQSITTATLTKLTWDQAGVDTGYRGTAFFNNANDSLDIPAGVTKVRLTTNIRWAATGTGYDQSVRLLKNASNAFDGSFLVQYQGPTSSSTGGDNASSAVIDVVAGDQFTLQVFQNSGGALNVLADAQDNTWFEIEVVETEEATQPLHQIDVYLDTAAWNTGALPTSAPVFKQIAARRFSLSDNLAGSQGQADNGPNGGAVAIDVQRNGTSIGTITFADSTGAAQTATFTTSGTGQEDFEIGDRLELVAPANWQSMDEIVISLFGFRT